MADTENTLQQLNVLFQSLILSMLGYAKTGSPPAYSKEAFYAVRVSWPTDGAPAWKITENVLFLRVQETDSEYNKQRDVVMSDVGSPTTALNMATSYTREIKLGIIAYGPNSFANIQTIRDKMFYPSNRLILAGSNLYLIPNIEAPVRFPELFQGSWWERVDMSLKFNELIIRNVEIPFIESAEVTINSSIVDSITVNIN